MQDEQIIARMETHSNNIDLFMIWIVIIKSNIGTRNMTDSCTAKQILIADRDQTIQSIFSL